MKTPDISLPEGMTARFGERPDQVAQALAGAVADALRVRLAEAGKATLVVSGGSTPLPFFAALSAMDLNWSAVTVLLADERWVDEDDAASNTRLVKASLLQNRAAQARYLSLKGAGSTPAMGVETVRRTLADLVRPLDVLVLGMGNDGHTASLFPDAPELAFAMDAECPDPVAAMTPPSQSEPRITLTLPVLAGARFTALHLKGSDKLETLGRALGQLDDVLSMPVRAFLKPGLQVFWSP